MKVMVTSFLPAYASILLPKNEKEQMDTLTSFQ